MNGIYDNVYDTIYIVCMNSITFKLNSVIYREQYRYYYDCAVLRQNIHADHSDTRTSYL